MREAVREMGETNAFGLPEDVARDVPIQIGIGINSGPACVGNVGSADRFNYSAIGDAVNVAARAESACKELAYDLVVCHSTAELAPDFAFLDAGGVPLKGKAEPVRLAILVGDDAMKSSTEFKALAERYRELIAALRDGRTQAADEALAACRDLAGDIEPGLRPYLDRLPERRGDFAVAVEREVDLVPAR